MTSPQTASAPRQYRSPQRKLVTFFEKSRNQWKAKCREAKAMVRRLKNRAAWLEHSRDGWKARACRLTQRVRALEAEMARREQELETLKKTLAPPLLPPDPPSPRS